ncbi:MAG: lamin tail domain-containing protein [Bacteroidales bacterium]|nr:lamin tail domain-containing protein [Candidatus Scybalocola fimicaballi]
MKLFIGLIYCFVMHFTDAEWKNVWSGDSTSFKVENQSLRLNAEKTQSSASISTKSDAIISATWRLCGSIDLNPTSSNYLAVFLASSSADVVDSTLSGYYLLLGKSNDEIALWKSLNGTQKKLGASAKKRLNFSTVNYDIVVHTDSVGNWKVMSKINDDEDYVVDFTANDGDIETSSYFILNPHFTKTRTTHFAFDSIFISTDFVDYDPPYVSEIERNDSVISIVWNEKIKPESVSVEANQDFEYLGSDEKKTHFKYNSTGLSGEYNLSISACDIRDNCSTDTTLKIYFSEEAKKDDVILNEVLFDVPTDGSEFVELYNNSDKWISAKSLFIATRKANGNLNYIIPLSVDVNDAIPPYSYIIISRDVENVCAKFDCGDDAVKFTLPKMPTLSNDGANVVLLDKKENVMDEFAYDPKIHSQFSNQDKGRSLERVSFVADEWASASDESGGATPGAKNSASSAKTEEINCVQSFITLDFPEIIIEYLFSKPNFKGSLLCFDRYGNPICTVYDYQLMDREGEWRWNGMDGNGNLLPTGIYVLVFEAVAEAGDRIRKKIVCTIGER